ncbi:ctaD, partial [Symbiodinium necroappetens]
MSAHDVSYLEGKGSLGKTIMSWIYTVDHKKIGVMYLVAVLTMFFFGGLFAVLLRLELFEPVRTAVDGTITGQFFKAGWTEGDQVVTSNNFYNRLFSLHGTIMVFLFIIPSIPAALGNIFLPIMIGAKDVAFPKLNLFSWYTYLFGGAFALWSLLQGGVETGWTFYTPYSTTTNWGNVTALVLAAFILGFSSIFTGMNFIATVHKLRVPGMGWFDMPLFVWAIYATAIIQVLATPVLGITLLMIVFERVFEIGIFDPALGGDPVLFQHFFCSIAIAAISFLVWGHHMFTAETPMANAIFSGLTFLVAIPTAIKVFNWVATMYKASIAINAPMLYAISFLFNFTIGGLTGPPLATLATDIHLHDTYFVVAHFHYVMMGGTVFAFVGGLHHWWP